MTQSMPVHQLRSELEAARLRAVEALAARGGALDPEMLREVATLQAALTAVREEIEAHAGRMGWGPEEPLE
jgi:hypothetical protein